MARYDHQFQDDRARDAEPRASLGDLIRPGLLKAFPLPAEGPTPDDRFRLLLDALAQRSGDTDQVPWPEAASRP